MLITESWKTQQELHPHLLTTVAALRGLSPTPAGRSKMLVIDPKTPAEVVPLAAFFPQATITVVRLSEFLHQNRSSQPGPGPEPTETLAEVVTALQLENVELHPRDQKDLKTLGPFDMLLSAEALDDSDQGKRSALLESSAAVLATEGLAVFGYHALPGWQPMADLGAWIRRRIAAESAPSDQITRARELAASLLGDEENQAPGGAGLTALARTVAEMSDEQLTRQLLDPTLRGLRLTTLLDEADAAGLTYLGDARRNPPLESKILELAHALQFQSPSRGELETLLDISFPRARRWSIFSRQDAPSTAENRLLQLDMSLLSFELRPEKGSIDLNLDRESFVGADGIRVEVTSRLERAALGLVTASWPRSVPLLATLEQAGQLVASADPRWAIELDSAALLQAKKRLLHLCELGLGVLRSEPLLGSAELEEKPSVHALSRWQLAHRLPVTTPHFVDVELDPFLGALAAVLDGTRDANAVAATLREAFDRGELELEVDGQQPKDELAIKHLLQSRILQGIERLRELCLIA